MANSIGMPAYVLDAVRCIDGVKYAVPLYSAKKAYLQGVAQRLQDTVALYAALGGGWGTAH